jgi:hypothetical protein
MERLYNSLAWWCGCLGVALLIVSALATPAMADGGGADPYPACAGACYCGNGANKTEPPCFSCTGLDTCSDNCECLDLSQGVCTCTPK